MPDLRKTRRLLTIVAIVLGVMDAVALVVLLTPVAGSAESRHQELQQLWVSLKGRESATWHGLDKKLPQTRQEIDQFYRERFPSGYSEISADLDKVAAETGVEMSSEKYEEKDSALDELKRIEIDASVSGDYVPLVHFINALERNKLFFVVDDLQLGGEQNGVIKLQVKLETYKRMGS
jgi:type IV pilus assembly protein PilO